MAFRSLAVSIFIVVMSFSYTLITALNADIEAANPGSGILNRDTPNREATVADIGWNKSLDSVTEWGLLNMANVQEEREGGNFGRLTVSKVLYNTLFYASTGFDDFLRAILGISGSNWDGSTVVVMIDLAMVMVMLNHGFVLLQLVMNIFGGI